jgi:flagellar hook-associated protein 2
MTNNGIETTYDETTGILRMDGTHIVSIDGDAAASLGGFEVLNIDTTTSHIVYSQSSTTALTGATLTTTSSIKSTTTTSVRTVPITNTQTLIISQTVTNTSTTTLTDTKTITNTTTSTSTSTISTTSTETVIQDLTSATLSSLGINTVQIKNTDGEVLETVNLSTYSTVGRLQNYLSNKYGINLYATTDSTGSYLESYGNDSIYADFGNKLSTSVSKTYQSSKLEIANPVSTIPVSESTLLSEFDNGILTAQGALVVRKESGDTVLSITDDETFGSFMEKLNSAGINTTLKNGYLTLGSMEDYELVSLTSNAPATLGLIRSSEEYGLQSSSEVLTNVSTVAEQTISVSNYADLSSKLSDLNISSGTLSIFRNGNKAIIHIDNTKTLSDLNSQISSVFSDVKLTLKDGKVVLSSTSGAKVEVGVNTDTSNFASIVGISNNGNNAEGTVALYKVNGNSVLTSSNLFRTGTVKAGTFTIGNATFTIDNTTTMDSIISQINSNEDSYANAYWDSINGQLVLTSTSTGASLMNIEAGTSNFTDILGLTSSTWNSNGTVKKTALNIDAQTLGENAKFSINGTNFVSSSNTVTSDISRISGLTLNLKGISEDGGSTTITVENDSQSVADALSEIVDGYNTLMENLETELSSTGNLSKETTLKSIKQQIRSLMLSSVSGLSTYNTLNSIGISVSAASASNISTTTASITDLTIDKDKFMEAYKDDPSEIKALLVGTTDNEGILTQIENIVENALQTATGYFDIASKAYDTKISTIDNKITKQNKIVEAYKTRLENKFNLMDQLISSMQNQYSSFLSS